MTTRVCVVVNKWWELDPMLWALLHDHARPASALGWPLLTRHPRPRPNPQHLPPLDPAPAPRAVFTVGGVAVEFWCISDLLEHLPEQDQASSERKAERLPLIFQGKPPALVIAVGTASTVDSVSWNGAVVVGTKVFIHNFHPGGSNPRSNWTTGPFDTVMESAVSCETFATLMGVDTGLSPPVSDRVFSVPLNPTSGPVIRCDHEAVALVTVNVTNFHEFEQADAATRAAFQESKATSPIGSVETTHGVIRAYAGDRFLFVSGIANRIGHFTEEVSPRYYSQNAVASHNAGVWLAWMLPRLSTVL